MISLYEMVRSTNVERIRIVSDLKDVQFPKIDRLPTRLTTRAENISLIAFMRSFLPEAIRLKHLYEELALLDNISPRGANDQDVIYSLDNLFRFDESTEQHIQLTDYRIVLEKFNWMVEILEFVCSIEFEDKIETKKRFDILLSAAKKTAYHLKSIVLLTTRVDDSSLR